MCDGVNTMNTMKGIYPRLRGRRWGSGLGLVVLVTRRWMIHLGLLHPFIKCIHLGLDLRRQIGACFSLDFRACVVLVDRLPAFVFFFLFPHVSYFDTMS